MRSRCEGPVTASASARPRLGKASASAWASAPSSRVIASSRRRPSSHASGAQATQRMARSGQGPDGEESVCTCTRASWPVLPRDPVHAHVAMLCLLRAGSSPHQSTLRSLRRQTGRRAPPRRPDALRGGRVGPPRRVHRTCVCRGVRWVLGWFRGEGALGFGWSLSARRSRSENRRAGRRHR